MKIEGVPEGYELVRIGRPKKGELYIMTTGEVIDCAGLIQSESGFAIVRKIEPKVRPMTRDEFLAAWKQRWFCPLIDKDGEIEVICGVINDDEVDNDIVALNYNGWQSLDYLAYTYKFASDNSPLTVEE